MCKSPLNFNAWIIPRSTNNIQVHINRRKSRLPIFLGGVLDPERNYSDGGYSARVLGKSWIALFPIRLVGSVIDVERGFSDMRA